MSAMGLNVGSKATFVTETHIITCIIKSVRLRDPCSPCSHETPVHLVPPDPYVCDPSTLCTPTTQKVSPCAAPPCGPCCAPEPPSTCEPCCMPEPHDVCGGSELQAKLAQQATERLNANEFEVALETGVAIKRN